MKKPTLLPVSSILGSDSDSLNRVNLMRFLDAKHCMSCMANSLRNVERDWRPGSVIHTSHTLCSLTEKRQHSHLQDFWRRGPDM
jgi:hypothetical protein